MSNQSLEFYKKLYLTRRAEEKIQEHYFDDEMKTPMHMSMGEEAIIVGACRALNKEDQVFGTYRNHALYLTRTGETDEFFAEMYGKETGKIKGRAGSMHLSAPEKGFIGTSAIVGGTLPIAVGAAFANKRMKNKRVVATFFGDGAIDEGCFWESLNVACLMKLPVLFVCEDNGFAVHTSAKDRHGYNSISDVVSKFNCELFQSDSTDVEEIFQITSKAIESIKNNQRPAFLHLKYYRYLEHVGVCEDYDSGYRSKEEFEKWKKRDPIDLQRKKLLENNFTEAEIEKIEEEIDDQIEKSIKLAKEAPFVNKKETYKDVFCDL